MKSNKWRGRKKERLAADRRSVAELRKKFDEQFYKKLLGWLDIFARFKPYAANYGEQAEAFREHIRPAQAYWRRHVGLLKLQQVRPEVRALLEDK